MRWRRSAMLVCAATVVVAGVITAVAGARDADAARPPAPPGGFGASRASAQGATAAYTSRVTIALDPAGGECASFPDADGSGRPHPVCGPVLGCYRRLDGPRGTLRLPTGDERTNRYQAATLGDRAAPFRGGTIYLSKGPGSFQSDVGMSPAPVRLRDSYSGTAVLTGGS